MKIMFVLFISGVSHVLTHQMIFRSLLATEQRWNENLHLFVLLFLFYCFYIFNSPMTSISFSTYSPQSNIILHNVICSLYTFTMNILKISFVQQFIL